VRFVVNLLKPYHPVLSNIAVALNVWEYDVVNGLVNKFACFAKRSLWQEEQILDFAVKNVPLVKDGITIFLK